MVSALAAAAPVGTRAGTAPRRLANTAPVFTPSNLVLSLNQTTNDVLLTTLTAAVDAEGNNIAYSIVTTFPTVRRVSDSEHSRNLFVL